jgi:hypothetical protein
MRLAGEKSVQRLTIRGGEVWQAAFAQGQRQIAALGNVHRVFQRLGQVGEQRRHLVLGLEILFRGELFRPPRVAQHITFGDADARLVGLEIVAIEKLHRMCRHQRQIEFRREIGAGPHQLLLRRGRRHHPAFRPLHFDVIGVGKQPRPVLRLRCRLRQPPAGERLADIAQRPAGQRDQAAVIAVAQLCARQHRAPLFTRREIGGAEQLAQAQITGGAFDQQQQARQGRACLGMRRRLVVDPHVAADDGFDALRARRRVKLDHAEQIGQIGQRQRRLPVRRRPRDGRVETGDAVADRVFAVQAKMNEAR